MTKVGVKECKSLCMTHCIYSSVIRTYLIGNHLVRPMDELDDCYASESMMHIKTGESKGQERKVSVIGQEPDIHHGDQ